MYFLAPSHKIIFKFKFTAGRCSVHASTSSSGLRCVAYYAAISCDRYVCTKSPHASLAQTSQLILLDARYRISEPACKLKYVSISASAVLLENQHSRRISKDSFTMSVRFSIPSHLAYFSTTARCIRCISMPKHLVGRFSLAERG